MIAFKVTVKDSSKGSQYILIDEMPVHQFLS